MYIHIYLSIYIYIYIYIYRYRYTYIYIYIQRATVVPCFAVYRSVLQFIAVYRIVQKACSLVCCYVSKCVAT